MCALGTPCDLDPTLMGHVKWLNQKLHEGQNLLHPAFRACLTIRRNSINVLRAVCMLRADCLEIMYIKHRATSPHYMELLWISYQTGAETGSALRCLYAEICTRHRFWTDIQCLWSIFDIIRTNGKFRNISLSMCSKWICPLYRLRRSHGICLLVWKAAAAICSYLQEGDKGDFDATWILVWPQHSAGGIIRTANALSDIP